MERRKIAAAIAGLFFLTGLKAQRGSDLLPQSETPKKEGKIYALIIGISDYQNIHDLKYADRDAQDFYNFLVNEAEPRADSANVKLLLNKDATSAGIGKAILALERQLDQGGTCFIYFAGHGDANGEAQAFLLGYDFPKTEDPGQMGWNGGIVHVYILKDEIRKMMAKKGATVFLITDACRTNEISGKDDGVRTYATKIMEQNSGEIQFMSCAPDEKSEEDEQWGKGRGVFSYYFTNGLRGAADTRPADNKVTAKELFEYVQHNVEEATRETNPLWIAQKEKDYRQSPQFCCSDKQNTQVIRLNEKRKKEMLARLQAEGKTPATAAGKSNRGGLHLKTEDTLLQKLYNSFYTALDEKRLIKPQKTSAYHFFRELQVRLPKESLTAFEISGDFKAALLNDAQQTINRFFSYTDNWGMSDKTVRTFYADAAAKLNISEELMDPADPMRERAGNMRRCIQAAGMGISKNKKDWLFAVDVLDSVIKEEPQNPLPYCLKGRMLWYLDKDNEATENIAIALRLAPNWDMPALTLTDILLEEDKADSAEKILTALCARDTIAVVYYNTGIYFGDYRGNYDTAIYYLKLAHHYAPEQSHVLNYIGYFFDLKGRTDSASWYYNKAYETDPNNAISITNIGIKYEEQDFCKAEDYFLLAAAVDSVDESSYEELGALYFNRFDKEEDQEWREEYRKTALYWLKKAQENGSTSSDVFDNMARLYADSSLEYASEIRKNYLKPEEWTNKEYAYAQSLVYYDLGYMYSEQSEKTKDSLKAGELKRKAAEYYQTALSLDSGYYKVYYDLAWLLSENDMDKAVQVMQKYIRVNGRIITSYHAWAYGEIGDMYAEKLDDDKRISEQADIAAAAEKYYKKAIETNRFTYSYYLKLAQLYAIIQPEKIPEAFGGYALSVDEQWGNMDSAQEKIYNRIGLLYSDLLEESYSKKEEKKYRKLATQYFEKAIKMNPANADYYYNMAVLYVAEDMSKAEKTMNRLPAIPERESELAMAFGKLYAEAKKHELSISSLHKVAMEKRDAAWNFLLAKEYYYLNNYDSAGKYIEVAVRLNPSGERVKAKQLEIYQDWADLADSANPLPMADLYAREGNYEMAILYYEQADQNSRSKDNIEKLIKLNIRKKQYNNAEGYIMQAALQYTPQEIYAYAAEEFFLAGIQQKFMQYLEMALKEGLTAEEMAKSPVLRTLAEDERVIKLVEKTHK